MGRLSHSQEHALYRKNKPAWCQYIAPRWRDLLKAATPERKRELWAIASPELRAELNRLKEAEK